MLAAALIDTTALWKIVVASLVGGVGVVVAFGLLLFSLSKGARAKGDGRPAGQAAYYLVSALCGLFCVAAVAFGIYAMVNKPSSPAPKPAKTAGANPGFSRSVERAIRGPGGIWHRSRS